RVSPLYSLYPNTGRDIKPLFYLRNSPAIQSSGVLLSLPYSYHTLKAVFGKENKEVCKSLYRNIL
ncbi:MAG: hypothetical protein NT023_07890, partial [Armatimonadetes bacterium]|nr:hypothetical protein [Armatimonadota bacterium]